jgi:transcriptional regulator GlxA family with amidase domain
MSQTIGIYLYNDVEVLDFAGPFEVFNTATRMHQRLHPENHEDRFEVVTIAEKPGLVRARAGLSVLPDCDINKHPPLDVLVGFTKPRWKGPRCLTGYAGSIAKRT